MNYRILGILRILYIYQISDRFIIVFLVVLYNTTLFFGNSRISLIFLLIVLIIHPIWISYTFNISNTLNTGIVLVINVFIIYELSYSNNILSLTYKRIRISLLIPLFSDRGFIVFALTTRSGFLEVLTTSIYILEAYYCFSYSIFLKALA